MWIAGLPLLAERSSGCHQPPSARGACRFPGPGVAGGWDLGICRINDICSENLAPAAPRGAQPAEPAARGNHR